MVGGVWLWWMGVALVGGWGVATVGKMVVGMPELSKDWVEEKEVTITN